MNCIPVITLLAVAAPCAAFANLPHAFKYGDKAFADIPAVEKSVQDADGRRKVVHEWTSPDGKLLLRTTETVYKNFPVREYLPELVAIGDAPTEIVDDFRSISISRAAGSATVRALHGTVGRDKDFEPVTVAFGEKGVGEYSFVATEGRSSAQWMPWLGLDFPEGDGLEIAVGWSGAWRADAALANGAFSFSAGMVKTHFRLLPGETVRQPSVLVFTRKAGVSPLAMQTLIHRFMLDEKCPRDAEGRLIKPILPITAGGGNKTPAMMRKIIDWSVANKMPFDCFWVDAGWNGPAHMPDLISNCGNMWYNFVGDWRFNPTVHPDGNLAKVSEAAHAVGMRMLLWVEPERCVCDPPPPLFKEHRDWLLPAKDEQIRSKHQLNVNLGNPAAREWVTETISNLIRDNKLDIYRQDFNMNALPLWQENDAPDRQGITEAKYIAGLYAFWDALRARFPHLVVENCASGGRRLDFEAVSRSHSYCRTDYAIGHHNGPLQVLDVQNVTLNTLAYQPFQGSETTPARFFDDYGFFSSVCAGSVFTPSDWDAGIVVNDFTPEQTAWFKKVFTAADRIRPFFEGDFYPLTDLRAPGSQDERAWCAYQMHRPDLDAGFVVCFRRLDTPSHLFIASLGGIDRSARYTVETYDGTTEQVDGRALANFTADLKSPRSFRLVFYSRAKEQETGGKGEHIAWRGDFPDPTLWKGADGKFYAYATPGGGLLASRYLASDDGLSWRALDRGPFGKELADEIRKNWKWVWAPDHAVVKGKNLLYVSLVNSAEDSAIGVMELDGDAGPARNLRIITRSKDTGIKDTIDPEVVVDPSTNRVWMFFGSVGKMHRVELAEDGLSLKDGAQYVHVAGRPVSENRRRDKVFEGAYLHRRDGWWYLFVSAGWYADASYNLRVGRSRTLDGVFRDREGRPMTEGFATPVLGSEGDFYGPGHNGDFLVGKDGVERIYYHCHWKGTDKDGRSPRIMLSRRLVWDADGWPKAEKQ